MSRAVSRLYEFGPFRLDAAERLLACAGQTIAVTPKAFDTLLALVEQSGRVVAKDDLLRLVWPDAVVEESTLAQNIFTLRKTLRERSSDTFIETVPKIGYRFVAPVRTMADVRPTAMAVLPFRPIRSGGRDEYLELGMADALITRLSAIDRLIVRPTSAVRRYMDLTQDPLAAGRELGVDLVLDGSVQRIDDRVRVTARLVTVGSGHPMWAGTFDERFIDIFAVQDSISDQIARGLALRLDTAGGPPAVRRETTDAEAYQLYLKGRYHWNKMTEEALGKAVQHFEQAIARDPAYALAHAGLADAYAMLGAIEIGGLPPREAMPKAKAAATRALAIDDRLAEAHTTLAFVQHRFDWDWPAAEDGFRRALALNPGYSIAYNWYANHLTAIGRIDEAIAMMTRALEHDPLSLLVNTNMGFPFYYASRFDEAIERFRKVINLDPSFVYAHTSLGLAYERKRMLDDAIAEYERAQTISGGSPLISSLLGHVYPRVGERDRALAILDELTALSRRRYVPTFFLARVHFGLGDRDRGVALLEQAYDERDGYLVWLYAEPGFAGLRDDERYQGLVRRMGFPPRGP